MKIIKTKIKLITLLSLAMLFRFGGQLAQAQSTSYSISDVSPVLLRNSGVIMEENVIKGYYLFYVKDKVKSSTFSYELAVLDDNLKETTKKTILGTKSTYLLESAFNGNSILLKFYDRKLKKVYYQTLDKKAKLGKKQTRTLNKYETRMYDASIMKSMKNTSTNPFGDKAFTDIYIYKEKKYTYGVQSLNNDGSTNWSYLAKNEKGVLTATHLASNSSRLLIMEAQSPSLMSKNYTFNILALDADGSEIFKISLAGSKYTLMPFNAFIDEAKEEIILMGQYYNASDKAMKSSSKGIFVKVIDFEGGDVSKTYLSWPTLSKGLSTTETREISMYATYFHSIERTKDGRIVAVGEQYRKQVSALGVASNLAFGDYSSSGAFEIKMANIVVLTLNKDFEKETFQIFNKKPHKVILPKEYQFVNQHTLAHVMKAYGYFDYRFTQVNKDRSKLTVAYVDLERINKRRKAVLNMLNYNAGEKNPTKDKFVYDTDATFMSISPAKPGFLLVEEYYRKDKKWALRLEPINN